MAHRESIYQPLAPFKIIIDQLRIDNQHLDIFQEFKSKATKLSGAMENQQSKSIKCLQTSLAEFLFYFDQILHDHYNNGMVTFKKIHSNKLQSRFDILQCDIESYLKGISSLETSKKNFDIFLAYIASNGFMNQQSQETIFADHKNSLNNEIQQILGEINKSNKEQEILASEIKQHQEAISNSQVQLTKQERIHNQRVLELGQQKQQEILKQQFCIIEQRKFPVHYNAIINSSQKTTKHKILIMFSREGKKLERVKAIFNHFRFYIKKKAITNSTISIITTNLKEGATIQRHNEPLDKCLLNFDNMLKSNQSQNFNLTESFEKLIAITPEGEQRINVVALMLHGEIKDLEKCLDYLKKSQGKLQRRNIYVVGINLKDKECEARDLIESQLRSILVVANNDQIEITLGKQCFDSYYHNSDYDRFLETLLNIQDYTMETMVTSPQNPHLIQKFDQDIANERQLYMQYKAQHEQWKCQVESDIRHKEQTYTQNIIKIAQLNLHLNENQEKMKDLERKIQGIKEKELQEKALAMKLLSLQNQQDPIIEFVQLAKVLSELKADSEQTIEYLEVISKYENTQNTGEWTTRMAKCVQQLRKAQEQVVNLSNANLKILVL